MNWLWAKQPDETLEIEADRMAFELRKAAKETKRQAAALEKMADDLLRQKHEDHGARLGAMLNQLMPKGTDE